MGKTLTEIAKDLKTANKKVQLIYAFNSTGKTDLLLSLPPPSLPLRRGRSRKSCPLPCEGEG
jgi:hypothetical protein